MPCNGNESHYQIQYAMYWVFSQNYHQRQENSDEGKKVKYVIDIKHVSTDHRPLRDYLDDVLVLPNDLYRM